MNNPRTQRLRVRVNEQLSAAKWNGLLDVIDEAIRTRPGPGVLRRCLPSSTILTATGRGGGGGSLGKYPFKVAMTTGAAPGMLRTTFNLGLISGIEPTIGGKRISFVDPTIGDVPFYEFSSGSAIDAKTGRGMLYWQIGFAADYSISSIEPSALAAVPAPLPNYTFFKLIGFLKRDPADPQGAVTFVPMLFSSLNHVASQRHGGQAVHRFWAV